MPPVHHVTKDVLKVSQILSSHFRCEEPRIKELLSLGAVHTGKSRIFEDISVPKGTHLLIHLKPNRFDIESVEWKGTVVADERDYLIAKKPGGIPVHGTPDNATENLLEQLRAKRKAKLNITQRLDTPVSGIMLFAKCGRFQEYFNRLLREGKVEKTYLALTLTPPPLGEHVHFLSESDSRKRKAGETGQECRIQVAKVTELKSKKDETKWYEVEVRPLSGRTHQIRVQLTELGSPIMGDSLYGYKGPRLSFSPRREIGLFSARLRFKLPDGKEVQYSGEPPWRSELQLV